MEITTSEAFPSNWPHRPRSVHFGWEAYRRIIVLLIAALAIEGCSASSGAISTRDATASPAITGAGLAPQGPQSTGMSYFGSSNDSTRLEAIWQARTQAKPFSDFPIGPGDEIVITVPAVTDLSDVTVRVSPSGDVSLPLVGQIHLAGLTETQVRGELKKRLTNYMYDPQFQLFVKEYQSRQVAVIGSVAHPGVFTLTGPAETILELISLAGGPTIDAADRVILLPATPWETSPDPYSLAAANDIAGGDPLKMAKPLTPGRTTHETPDPSSGAVREISVQGGPIIPKTRGPSDSVFTGSNGNPVVIAMRSNSMTGSNRFLNLPLRPGDVVVVPSGGQVAVIGWVYTPGSFKVTSGLSALSAIGAAGGPTFAANEHDVHLLRNEKDGTTRSISLDLAKVRSGEEADITVQGNDVIEVPYSNSKIVPYIVYNILQSKVGGVGYAF